MTVGAGILVYIVTYATAGIIGISPTNIKTTYSTRYRVRQEDLNGHLRLTSQIYPCLFRLIIPYLVRVQSGGLLVRVEGFWWRAIDLANVEKGGGRCYDILHGTINLEHLN